MSWPGQAQINVGQWNAPVYVNAGTDLRGRDITVILIRPDGTESTGPGHIATPEENFPSTTMLPFQWCVYMIQNGDLTMKGLYTIELVIDPVPPTLQIPQFVFQVGA